MRFLSTQIHGTFDYIAGAVLIVAPFILGFATGGAAMWVPIILGAIVIGYSLMTDYESGINDSIDMRTHLGMDVIAAVILAVSPWLFGFSEVAWLPHLVLGLSGIVWSLGSEHEPSRATTSDTGTTTPA
jgi:hypothetical protein